MVHYLDSSLLVGRWEILICHFIARNPVYTFSMPAPRHMKGHLRSDEYENERRPKAKTALSSILIVFDAAFLSI
jgi:hypothetical protein